ncbi:hypothetical protein SAMN02745126_00839 [Enhydrobacter aerosaccus]|uniref:Glycosyltransferase RgtA/B/C/D-like domain-containing protein n=1 Tax=Enhydrobacter aerosaccus TaxID=225324 RepID=A0A1T4KAB0_9HYPH|nr:hypothetical protein [Enhydrobacter aerosaccus]SJZ39255.1 hypothetical protein SAMN02745126_00839 [Enhydrobacter aerosaccus]
MKTPSLGRHLPPVFILSLLFLTAMIAWLQNVHILTANGMYKSIQAEPWIHDFAHARLDQSNYLYFPLYGFLAHLLDLAGILKGVAWKQFAYLNAFWASLCLVCVYAFVLRFTGSVTTAILATLFHLGTGFFLLLAVISEDIMPGYTLVLGSMLLAALWFDRPTHWRVIAVAILFTLGWLTEWRLIFPTLPAFVLALAIADAPLRQRLGWIATLLVTIVAVTGIVQQVWEGHNGAVGLPDLLWTGKGVDSGWGGLSWSKAWMMLAGLGNYLFITGNYFDPASAARGVLPLSLSVLIELAIFVVGLALLWPRRAEPRLRAVAAVFLGTLAAGQAMNLYSQPQDPQMQVNVMPWLTVTWALIVATVLAGRRWAELRPKTMGLLAVLSLVPLAWNVVSLARWRGEDAAAVAAVAEIERYFPTDRTVFLYWGFEYIATWQYALWSHTWDWDFIPPPGPAPSDWPRFKWIAVNAGAIRHPQWTAEQHAAALKQQIDLAFRLGYRIAVSDFWNWSEDELARRLGGVSASARAPALYDMLHHDYEVVPVFSNPLIGPYYELRRRSPP